MTERLYNKDAYMKEASATIAGMDGNLLVLDRTVFAPDSGGQPWDLGTINGMKVLSVTEKGGEIYHELGAEDAAGLNTGDTVELKLDWDRRFDHMQNHIGEHILSGIFKSEYGLDNKGFHLGDEMGTFDIDSKDVTPEMIAHVEDLANDVVYRALPIEITMVRNAEEASEFPLRKELKADEDIIIVTIPGVDCVACCCPHPSDTSQVGIIKIIRTDRYKGMTRITFKCGRRAFLDYRQKHDVMAVLAGRYSADEFSLLEKMKNADRKNDEMHSELNRVKDLLAEKEAMDLLKGKESVIYGEISGDMDLARRISRKITDRDQRPVVLSSVSDRSVLMACSGKCGVDFGKTVKEHGRKLGGKGGGKADSAQAFFEDEDAVRKFAELAVREAMSDHE